MSSSQRIDSRRLQWLGAGFVLYFSTMLYCARYARSLPYQVLLIAAVLNMTVILIFVFSIKRAYLRTKRQAQPENIYSAEVASQSPAPDDSRRLMALWIGAGLYSVVFVRGLAYGIAYAGRMPLLILILAEIFNGSILAAFLLAIREVYKKGKSGMSSPS